VTKLSKIVRSVSINASTLSLVSVPARARALSNERGSVLRRTMIIFGRSVGVPLAQETISFDCQMSNASQKVLEHGTHLGQ